MIPLAALAAGVKILSDIDANERDTRRLNHELDLAEKREKTERYAQYAKTATDVIGVLGGLYMDYKRNQAEMQRSQQNFGYQSTEQQFAAAPQARSALPPPPPSPMNASYNQLVVDYDSIWIDDSNNTFGATVINRANGQMMNYGYYLQRISDTVQNIFESIDGSPWRQVGVLDSDRITPEAVGTPQLGGPIFAEIFLTILEEESQQEPDLPPVPQQLSAPKAAPAQIAAPAQQSSPRPDMSYEEYEEYLQDVIDMLADDSQGMSCVYFAGMSDKANTKIQSAIKAYAPQARNENVIFVFDNTFFGAADEGFLMTDQALYNKESSESPKRIDIHQIGNIEVREKNNLRYLLINNEDYIFLAGYDVPAAQQLVQLVIGTMGAFL